MLRLSKALLLAIAIAFLPLHGTVASDLCPSEGAHSQAGEAPVPSEGEHGLHCNLCAGHCAAISGGGDARPAAVPAAESAAMNAAPPPAFILDTLDRPPLALLH
jgi:hypothetical protein